MAEILQKCPHCRHEEKIQAYPGINVSSNPELKDKVKDGSLFLWKCSNCGASNLAVYQSVYHDPSERLLVWLAPAESGGEADSAASSIARQLDTPEGRRILDGYALRKVTKAGDLMEKVRIFDCGLDDVAMEMAEKESDRDKAAAILALDLKFVKTEGADNDLIFTYPDNGSMTCIKAGFNVYEDCRGIVQRNPDIRPTPGFAIVDAQWLSSKIR